MLENGSVLTADGRQYTIIEMLGKGANTVAYLAECRHDELVTKCILKEYSPQNSDDFEKRKARFIASGKAQNKIRQISSLNNQTPPISHIFEANGTAYIDVACYNGTTLDKLNDLKLSQYMEICRTITKTVGYYHKSGYICLDLKPENIFIMRNTPDDTITQLVEFIDFDSIRNVSGNNNTAFSYTRNWAAPEQLIPYTAGKISFSADIYTIGEIVFYFLFGRHSTEDEHRGFSNYPYEECEKYRRYVKRPDIQALFTRLFRGTIRSSANNRFKDIDEAADLLNKLVTELERKDYIIPKLPSVSPDFVGRDTELKQISQNLKNNPVLFVTGVGGIGKSTLVKNYISRYRTDYDVVVYLEFDGDIRHTFCDDMQLQLSTVSSQREGSPEDIFTRKLTHFKNICGEKRVLFVLDNFSGKITKDLSRIIDCGYDTIIVTRNQPPKNSFCFMEIGAISDNTELFKLIVLNLERTMSKDEQQCFEEIITLVQGHTLAIELIARQIAAGRLDIHTALELIRENGFSRFSAEKIGNYKDGEEVYDTLSAIISALFDAGSMSAEERLTLKIMSLLDVRGLERSLVHKNFPNISADVITKLARQGWIYADDIIRVHSVISETAKNWAWNDIDDVTVMEYHQNMTEIYARMSNSAHICEILREAEIYKNQHQRHIITAMYYDMVGWYYDVITDGNYVAYTDEEAEIVQKLKDYTYMAIVEMELSSDSRKTKYLTKYYSSMANILIRSTPDCYDAAAELLGIVHELIEENEPEISENRCYYCRSLAWYYTLAKPDIARTREFAEQAESIAKQVFSVDLDIIDTTYIPAANCYYFHNDFCSAANKLEEAIEICRQYPDMLTYIDKQAELMNCLLDVYMELQDMTKCRELISEIDRINEEYKDQGICREVDPEIRKEAGL